MYVSELECLNKPQSFINRTANWKIIYCDLSEFLHLINDEESSEWYASVFIQDSICPGQFSGLVCNEGNVHVSQTSLLAWSVDPGQVGEVTITGSSEDFTVYLLELFCTV